MDEIGAVEETMAVSGYPDGYMDELSAYINQVELEFASEVDDILEMFNMSYLRIRC
jgi:hypothetical protein